MKNIGRKALVLFVMTIVLALMPFLFWRATWFGRRLNDKEIEQYLTGDKPRLIQHALAQVAERIVNGEIRPANKAAWYPTITTLADRPEQEIRNTVAWVMGQDNSSAEFHDALLRLLHDREPLVRRNAALSLVRFADSAARPEILAMLRPYAVLSPGSGTISLRLSEDDFVNPGTLLGSLLENGKHLIEIRSPLPGKVLRRTAVGGETVRTGQPVFLLAPAPQQVWEALRALVLVGRAEDLPEVDRVQALLRGEDEFSDKIRQQAAMTIIAIKGRLSDQRRNQGM